MDAEQVGNVFNPFTQADTSTTRRFGGTGLGLAICRRLANILGGDIHVIQTAPGVGTRMRVTIDPGPLNGARMIERPELLVAAAHGGVEPARSPQEQALNGVRVLLAEDGPDNQRLIDHILRRAGASVTVVENGRIAVDAAMEAKGEGAPFDVLLMDMQMPVLDGYEATRQLRTAGYTAPIIALTAHAMATDKDKCLQAGCDDYAAKPIDPAQLIATIQRHLLTPARR
jgi:CheY-like chemotaxis protein